MNILSKDDIDETMEAPMVDHESAFICVFTFVCMLGVEVCGFILDLSC